MITFTRRLVSPRVRSSRLECRMRLWCSAGGVQVGEECREVVLDAGGRCGIEGLALRDEPAGATAPLGERLVA